MALPATININTDTGNRSLEINRGNVIFVVGPNGSGKSALLHNIARSNAMDWEILPGHRQIFFQNEDVDQFGMTLSQLRQHLSSPASFNRYRGHVGEAHLKSFVRRFLMKEIATNAQISELVRSGASSDLFLKDNPSLVNSLNEVFSISGFSVSFSLAEGQLKASKNGNIYSIDRLSDGERAALLLCCAIFTQPPEGVVLIDEPEKHINIGISGPLIATAFLKRPDLAYIVSSHDLNLIKWLQPAQIVHLKDCRIISAPEGRPEEIVFGADIITASDTLSKDIRHSVLGARDKVLFVEGEATSDDRLLYGRVFKEHRIMHSGGADTVIANVRALDANEQFAWLSACGLIDGDGRKPEEVSILRADGIFCILAPTIENLFMDEDILRAMAEEHLRFFGGESVDSRMALAARMAEESLQENKLSIVRRRTVWSINRLISASKVSVKQLSEGLIRINQIDISDVLKRQHANFEAAMDALPALEAIKQIPIKNTNIPHKISQAIGYDKFGELKQATFQQIDSKTSAGKRILAALLLRLPQI